MITRLKKEAKEKYVDIFKMSQYLTWLAFWVIELIYCWIILPYPRSVVILKTVGQFNRAQVFLFLISNQLSWFVLIYHITQYQSIETNRNYEEIRTKILTFEYRIQWIVTLTYFMYVSGKIFFSKLMLHSVNCHFDNTMYSYVRSDWNRAPWNSNQHRKSP